MENLKNLIEELENLALSDDWAESSYIEYTTPNFSEVCGMVYGDHVIFKGN